MDHPSAEKMKKGNKNLLFSATLQADNGCLGRSCRGRTYMATIVAGEEPYSRDPAVSEWRNPSSASWISYRKDPAFGGAIATRGAPRELKHLTNARKRNTIEIPSVAASESGRA